MAHCTCMLRRPGWMSPAYLAFFLVVFQPLHAHADAWEIDTYGNGDMLKSAFDAIVAFSGANGGMASALKLVTLIALVSGLGSAAAGILTGRSPFLLLPYTIVTAGLVGSLSAIPATVIIHDAVAITDDVVDNVPLPLAIIGHMTSSFGQRLTQQVEEAIQPADIQRFTSTGLGWGPRVIQATLKAAPLDQKLLTDLDAFIRLCVIPDIQMNRKTVEQIVNAKTADEILGGTNPAIAVLLPNQCDSQGRPEGCTPTNDDQRCPDAYSGYLEPRLTQAASDPDFLQTIAAQIGTPYAQVAQSIGDVTNSVLQISQDGYNLLKLRFVTNQLLPSVQAYAAIGGQSATLTAWAAAEAQNQQISSWLNIGLILQQTLPIFHAALEFLFYAFMLFAIPLIVVRPQMLIEIGSTALWLQLWPLAYVFGNLFLYRQLDKISFMTDPTGMDLGLSYTTTQPLLTTIQSAYAASGFPVMIGIMMIGGMIFGGSFALTKAISAGPFSAGARYGTAAALGNVSAGNASVEQRTLAPTTTRIRDGMVDTVYGDMHSPVLQQQRSGYFRESGVSFGSIVQQAGSDRTGGSLEARLGGGQSLIFDSASGRLTGQSLPVSARTSAAAVNSLGSALTRENAAVQARTKELQNAEASQMAKTLDVIRSREASDQAGISEGTRESVERATQFALADTLQNTEAGEEFRQHVIRDMGIAGIGGNAGLPFPSFKLLQSGVGASGRLEVQAQFADGQNYRTTLSHDASQKVLRQTQETLGRTKEYQHMRQEVDRHGDTSRRSLGIDHTQRASAAFSDAVSQRDAVATTLEATKRFTAEFGSERGHIITQALWDKMHPGVNMAQAFRNDTDDAKSFAAFLKSNLSTPEGLQQLAAEGLRHLDATGQLDQHKDAEWQILGQRPQEPTSAGLKAPRTDPAGTGFVEPAGHPGGAITKEVKGHLATANSTLAPNRQALHHVEPRLMNVPTETDVKEGVQKVESQTHGGPLKAGFEAGKEAVVGTAKDVGNAVGEVIKRLTESGG